MKNLFIKKIQTISKLVTLSKDIRKKLNLSLVLKKVLSIFLSITIFTSNIQICYAVNVIKPSSSDIYLDTAANGAPVINIANPNAAGISHNQYIDFNVGKQGIILNNSMHKANSEIGGIVVFANNNLSSEASTIINEVVSNNPSRILGPTEILGRRADYVLANPNGIILNNASFINVNNATITTGRPEFDSSGALSSLIVDSGNIEILGKDLDVTGLSYFDIIAKTANIASKVHAGKDLRVVVGSNSYDYKQKAVTSSRDSSVNNTIAIDGKAVGGLYAGKVKIISTDKGVGVNLPDLESKLDNLEITADGKVIYKNLNSAKDIKIKSSSSTITSKNDSKVISNSRIDMDAFKDVLVKNGASVNAKDVVDIKANKHIDNQGSIASDENIITLQASHISNSGPLTSQDSIIKIRALNLPNNIKLDNNKKPGDFDNQGVITSKDISIELDGSLNNWSSIKAKSRLLIRADQTIFNKQNATINSNGELKIFATNLYNDLNAKIESLKNTKIELNGNISPGQIRILDNKGNIKAFEELNLKIKNGELINKEKIESINNSLIIDSDDSEIINSGTLFSHLSGSLNKATRLENSGEIIGKSNLDINIKGDINNSGTIKSDDDLEMKSAKNIYNSKFIKSLAGISLSSKANIDNISYIIAQTINIDSDAKLHNMYEIKSADGLKINAKDIENSFHIKAGLVELSAESIVSTGPINSDTDINIKDVGIFENSGLIKAGGQLELSNIRERFKNDGEIFARDLDFNMDGEFITSKDLTSDNLLQIKVGGDIQITDGKLKGALINLETTQGLIKNEGKIIARDNVKLKSVNALENLGLLKSGSLDIVVTNGAVNSSGTVDLSQDFAIDVQGEFSNAGTITAKGNLDLKKSGSIKNSGFIDISDKLIMKSSGDFQNLNKIKAGNLNSNIDGDISNLSEIKSDDFINLNTSSDFDNQGKITSQAKFEITAIGELKNKGRLQSEDILKINSAKFDNQIGSIIVSKNDLHISSDDVENQGSIASLDSASSLLIDSDGELKNSGEILSDGKITILSEDILSNAINGKINAAAEVVIEAQKGAKNDGEIRSDKEIKLTIHGVDFNNCGIIESLGGGIDINILDGGFENDSIIKSPAHLKITAKNDIKNLEGGRIKSMDPLEMISNNASISNEGNIKSKNIINITAATSLVNSANIISTNDTEAKAKTIENSGYIQSLSGLSLTSENDINNSGNGKIEANKILKIKSDSGSYIQKNLNLKDGGLLSKNSDILISSAESIKLNKGTIEAFGNIIINGGNGLENIGANLIAHKDSIISMGGAIMNEGLIQSGHDTNIKKAAKLVNKSLISAGANNDISIKGDIENTGLIQAQLKNDINAGGNLINDNLISSWGDSKIDIKGSISNSGKIFADQNLTLINKSGDLKNTGTIVALTGRADLSSSGNIINDNGYIWGAKAIKIASTGGGLSSSGKDAKILTKDDLDINAEYITLSKGNIEAKQAKFNANSGDFKNDNASIITESTTINAQNVENTGAIHTKESLDIVASNDVKLNATGEIISNKLVNIVAGNDFENNAYLGGDEIKITATEGKLINKSDLVANQLNLVAKGVHGFIENSGNINSKSLNIDTVGNLINSKSLNVDAILQLDKVGKIINKGNIKFGTLSSLNNTKISAYEGGSGSVLEGGSMDVNIGNVSFPSGSMKINNLLKASFDSANLGNLEVNGGTSSLRVNNILTNNKLLNFKGSAFTISAHYINNTATGLIKGNYLTIDSSSDISNNGTFFGSGSLAIKAPRYINNGGGFFSNGSIAVTASNLNNGGSFIVGGYGTIAVSDLANSGTITSLSSLDITSSSINNSSILAGKTSLSLSGSLTNTGDIVSGYKAGGARGNININTNNSDFTNNGTIASYGSINLKTNSLTNNNTIEAYDKLTSIQQGNITNKHTFYAGSMDLSAGGNIQNDSRIITRDDMLLKASKDIVNTGDIKLLGNGSITLRADNVINKISGVKINGVDASTVGTLLSKSLMDSWKNTITFSKVNKKSQMGRTTYTGSWSDFKIPGLKESELTSKNIVNAAKPSCGTPVLISTNKETYTYSQRVSTPNINKPTIFSNNSIKIQANNLIDNTAGLIEAKNNIQLDGTTLSNKDYSNVDIKVILPTELKKSRPKVVVGRKYLGTKKRKKRITFSFYEAKPAEFKLPVNNVVVPSIIAAGGTLAGNLANEAINGSAASGNGKNVSTTPGSHNANFNYNYGSAAAPNSPAMGSASIATPSLKTASEATSSPPTAPNFVSRKSSELQTGPVALAKKYLTNGDRTQHSLQPDDLENLAAEIADSYNVFEQRYQARRSANNDQRAQGGSSSNMHAQAPRAPPELDEEYTPTALADLSFNDPDIQALINSAKWSSPPVDAPYHIKETSRIFTDFDTYFSTEQFGKKILGYNPQKTSPTAQAQRQLHYGDKMKQAELVMKQHQALTGLSSIEDGKDTLEGIKTLYERGIDFSKKHNLGPNISISPEVLAEIKEDMVLAQEIELDDKLVVIPKLYLGKDKRGMQARGMIASNIDLKVGGLKNDSNIIASNLSIEAGSGGISNTGGGLIQADKNLNIRTDGDIKNIASDIKSSGTASLAARNIYNITQKDNKSHLGRSWQESGRQAEISSVSDMFIQTSGDLRQTASKIVSGNLGLVIGGDMVSSSLDLNASEDKSGGNVMHHTSSRSYIPSIIKVAGDTQAFVSGDFALVGSSLNSGGDNELDIGGNSYVHSQIAGNYSQRSSSTTKRKLVGSSRKTTTNFSAHESLFEASISAGGGNVITSKGDQEYVGAKLKSSKGTKINGRTARLAALLTEDSEGSSSNYRNIAWQKDKASGYQQEKVNTTNIEGGLQAGDMGSIELEYDATSSRKHNSFAKNNKSIKALLSFSKKKPEKAAPEWMKEFAASNTDVHLKGISGKNESWKIKQEGLTPEAAAVVKCAVTVASVLTTGGVGTSGFVKAVTAAGISSFMGHAAVSTINNKGNLGRVAEDVTSKETLKSIGTSMALAGINYGVVEHSGFGNLNKLSEAGEVVAKTGVDRFIALGQRSLVQGASSSALTGERLDRSLGSSLASNGLAGMQTAIGDIGLAYDFEEGGVGKTIMHAAAGGLYSSATGGDFASGALGGAVGEVVGSRFDIDDKKATSKLGLVASVTSFALGGDADSISNASAVASSSFDNNRRLHVSEKDVLKELQEGKSAEERMRLEKAAKYLVHADEGVSDHDPLKGRLSRDVAEGEAYTKEQEILINRAQAKRAEAVRENQGKVTSSLGFMSLAAGDSALMGGYNDARANNRVFDYSFSDIASDAVSRRENVVSGVSGGVKAVSGSFGAAGSLGLATTMEFSSLGTATPALGVLAYTGYESYNYAAEGTNQLFETHQYREGQAVEDSFRSGNNSSYLGEQTSNLTADIAIATGAGKAFRAATKLEGAIASSYAKLRAHPATTSSTTAKAGGKIGEQITKLFSKAAGKNSSKSASKTVSKESKKSVSAKGGKESTGNATPSLSKNKNVVASNANSRDALSAKMKELNSAQNKAKKTKTLPDGRIRYYSTEKPSKTIGPTRGASKVTEYNPLTGDVRSWYENYTHAGKVNRVHPKSINGQDVQSLHYPMTKKEIETLLKRGKK